MAIEPTSEVSLISPCTRVQPAERSSDRNLPHPVHVYRRPVIEEILAPAQSIQHDRHASCPRGLPPFLTPKYAVNVIMLGRMATGKTTLIKSLLYVLGCLDVQTRISHVESIHQEALEAVKNVEDMLPEADWTRPMLDRAIVSEAIAEACTAFCNEPAFRQKVADWRREGGLAQLPQSTE
jgi:hypothetical protein